MLVERLRATHVSVGENFRFGHGAAGDTALLAADARFETRVVTLVEVDGEIVSSSHIRALVLAGDVEHAARFLGAPFQLRGEVVRGRPARPHARLPDRQPRPRRGLICPGHGVYAARADGACAAVSVGVRPTFGTGRGRARRGLSARPRRRPLRQHAARSSSSPGCAASGGLIRVEALVEQMRDDVEQTRRLCG